MNDEEKRGCNLADHTVLLLTYHATQVPLIRVFFLAIESKLQK